MSAPLQFGRRIHFDERSRDYPVRTAVAGKEPRSYTWRCTTLLNQGSTGHCVGFSFAHELAARPVEVPVTNRMADRYYEQAKSMDEWPGDNYEGTSVLAGARNGIALGFFARYRWAFNLNDVILALGHAGPAVLGINWHEGMSSPDKDGWIKPSGDVVGGHAILCKGVSLNDEGYFTLHNSWGKAWGVNGCCRISFDDLYDVLADQGEACIPEGRHNPVV